MKVRKDEKAPIETAMAQETKLSKLMFYESLYHQNIQEQYIQSDKNFYNLENRKKERIIFLMKYNFQLGSHAFSESLSPFDNLTLARPNISS